MPLDLVVTLVSVHSMILYIEFKTKEFLGAFKTTITHETVIHRKT